MCNIKKNEEKRKMKLCVTRTNETTRNEKMEICEKKKEEKRNGEMNWN